MNVPQTLAPRGLRRFVEAEAHHRLAAAGAVAVLTFGLAFHYVRLTPSLIAAWDAFALCSLVMAWLGMVLTDARTRVREARLQDSSRSVICFCVALAAVAGLLGATHLLGAAKALKGMAAAWHVGLAMVTVISSWLLAHTILALHYTHVFYGACPETGSERRGAGVVFPEEPEPDFLDFAYFSFVIGMTCQVSDVQVTSRRMRRLVLVHGLLSFVFNTIILAFSVNLATTLL